VSRRYAAELVQRLQCRQPDLRLLRRDLVAEPPSLVDRAFTEAMHVPAASRDDQERRALCESERLITELEMADIVVIATPMHNFTVPVLLKAWIDQVLRVGRSFDTTPHGKVGRLSDRPTVILVASGGRVTGKQARQPDFLTPYVRAVLATVGIRTTHFLHLEGTTRDPHWAPRIRDWMDTHFPLPAPSLAGAAKQMSAADERNAPRIENDSHASVPSLGFGNRQLRD
jgi:FMN-dependent NADH-azoreductase